MRWSLRLGVSLIVFGLTIPTYALRQQTYNLNQAKTYYSTSHKPVYIQTHRFKSKSEAKQYQDLLQTRTRYPVKIIYTQKRYNVTVGPILSDRHVRLIARLIENEVKIPVKQKNSIKIKKSTPIPKPSVTDSDIDTESVAEIDLKNNKISLAVEQKPKDAPLEITASNKNHWYASAGGGMEYPYFHSTTNINNGSGFPPPSDKDRYSFKQNTRPILSLGGGYRFAHERRWLPSYSLGLSYQYIFSNDVGGAVEQFSLPAFTNYNYQWNISSNVLLLSGKLALVEYKHILPYVNLGLGAAMIYAGAYNEIPKPGIAFRTGVGFANKSTFNFAYSVGAGIDYQVNEQVILSAGYEYLRLGNIHSGNGAGTWSGTSLNLGSYRVNEGLISLTYLFDYDRERSLGN